MVRVTHWMTTLCFFALLVSGIEIIISHPRFYWGEDGNAAMTPLFVLPIPASRPTVPTAYNYVLPDQNGWSRNLHFQAAWLVFFTGCIYVIGGVLARHFHKNLLPARTDLTARSLTREIVDHLRFKRPAATDAASYNVLQRLTYLSVVFLIFPLLFWTGLAMSPAIVSAFPVTVTVLGGQQSARTLHFFLSALLAGFLLVHLTMLFVAGFNSRTRAMITGEAAARKETE